jgi:hypothetical protein
MTSRSVFFAAMCLAGLASAAPATRPGGSALPGATAPGRSLPERIDQLAATAARLPGERRVGVVRGLQALGPAALDPMLARLQADSPAMATLRAASPRAHRLFVASLAEAVGTLKSPKSVPIFQALLDGPGDDPVLARSAADGLGKLCRVLDTAPLLVRRAAPGHRREQAALGGLAHCRVELAVRTLVARLADPDPETAKLSARSLGTLGSSWAWKALGPDVEAEGLRLRTAARAGVLAAYPAADVALRRSLERTLHMLELPGTDEAVAEARKVRPR